MLQAAHDRFNFFLMVLAKAFPTHFHCSKRDHVPADRDVLLADYIGAGLETELALV